MGKNYWMIVDSAERYAELKEKGFSIYGVGSKFRRRAQRMQPDDQVIFYIRGLRKWGATAVIKSKYFTDETEIWKPGPHGETYPYRVEMAPELVLEERDYIDALILAPRLEYVKRWAPEDWPLAFFDTLHLLPQKDFRLIEDEMKRIVKGSVRPRRRPRARNREQGDRDQSSQHESRNGNNRRRNQPDTDASDGDSST